MIGRKIYYNLSTGEVLCATVEKQGAVHRTTPEQDLVSLPELAGKSRSDVGIIELAFGERAEEFSIYGSLAVNPATLQLMIYPHLSVLLDKPNIKTAESANLTVTVPAQRIADTITLTVDGVNYTEPLTDGKAVFSFSSEVEGIYQLAISSVKHGSTTAAVEVVT